MTEQVDDIQNVLKEKPKNDIKYFDFEIKVSRETGKEYQIIVINSSGEQAQASMHFPFEEEEIEAYLSDLRFVLLSSNSRPRNILSEREQAVKAFGQRLFETLIVGEIKDLYVKSQEEVARVSDTYLKLRLYIEEKELGSLPWEFLYDSQKNEYICLTDNTSLVRYVAFPEPIQPLTLKPPLQILGMIANPNDQDPIDREHEMSIVRQALKDLEKKGLVKITWIEKQTSDVLQQYIQEAPWHIFYFIGHGRYEHKNSEGQFAFVTNNDQTDWISAKQIADMFKDCSSLRLMILDACEGARGSERDIFTSSASVLVSQGVPAVLTMQYKIIDDAKIKSIHAFYKALLERTLLKEVPVDMAVMQARKAINPGTTNKLEFGILTLYTSLSDGILFEWPQKKRQWRKFFLKIPWGSVTRIIAFLFLFVGIIMLLLSYFSKQDILFNIISLCILIFGFIGTIIPYLIRISPAPTISDYLDSFRQVLFWLKRFAWPSPSYSRRWFLKGIIFGSGSAFLITTGLYLLVRKLTPYSYNNVGTSPSDYPMDTPTPAPGFPRFTYSGHRASVYAVVCSPSTESKQVASAGADRTVQVWSWDVVTPTTNKSIIYYEHTESVNSIAWSPNGQRIASGSDDQTVKVWEVATQNTLFTYTGHTARVNAVACSPNSKYIASASDDHTVQIFDAVTGKHVYTYSGHHNEVNAVAWSPDSKRIASASGSTKGAGNIIHVWNATTGNLLATNNKHQGKITDVAWSPTPVEISIASSSYDNDTAVQVWNPDNKRIIYIDREASTNYASQNGNTGVRSVAWSPNGKRIAATGPAYDYSNEVVHIFDADNGQNESDYQVNDYGQGRTFLNSISWTADGKNFFAGGDDYGVYMW